MHLPPDSADDLVGFASVIPSRQRVSEHEAILGYPTSDAGWEVSLLQVGASAEAQIWGGSLDMALQIAANGHFSAVAGKRTRVFLPLGCFHRAFGGSSGGLAAVGQWRVGQERGWASSGFSELLFEFMDAFAPGA